MGGPLQQRSMRKILCSYQCRTHGMHSAVKYLYKYVYKGHDHATIILKSSIIHHDIEQARQHRQRNEIKEYLGCRYISIVDSC